MINKPNQGDLSVTYCKVKTGITEYGGWVGVVNGLVSETIAQGRCWSVSVAADPDSPLKEVYLPESALLFFPG